MKKLLAIVLAVMLLAMGLVAPAAYASVIQEDVFTWTATNADGTIGEVEIVEQMLDEEQTAEYYLNNLGVVVSGQEAFIYHVTNVSWTPINGANGFSGFNIRNVYNVGTVGNAFGPPGWEAFAGYSGPNTPPNPANFEWDIRDDVGLGLMVGQSGDFGFTVQAGQYGDSVYYAGSPPIHEFWMHSWFSAIQTDTADQMYISGPVPFWVNKWLEDALEVTGDGDGIIDLGEEWHFTIGIAVFNDAQFAVNNIMVKDNFGGDLRVVSVDLWGDMMPPTMVDDPSIIGGKKPTWTDGTTGVKIQWTGKTQKAHFWWNVGALQANFSPPPQMATLFVVVATDTNPGKGKNAPHQEYTSEGEHCLNSGATASGDIDSDWPGPVWDRSPEICVETGSPPPVPNG